MKLLTVILAIISTQTLAQSFTVDLVKDSTGVINNVHINGSGFGEKLVPVFYDQAGEAYENGVLNNTFSFFTPDRPITKNDTLFNTSAPWNNINGTIYIQSLPEHQRSSQTGKYYNGKNVFSNLQNPRAHSRSGTPVESKKVYISWWFKQQNETRNYFQHELGSIDTDFNPKHGDEFSVDVGPHWTGITTVYGRVISYDHTTRILHANYYDQNNANRITGKQLTLDGSATRATLSVLKRNQGSNKYLRAWESDGTAGSFRSSWTNTEIYQGDFRRVQRSKVTPRQWNHLEYFADQNTGLIMTKVNGVVDSMGFYTSPSDVAGHSPTIGLIGQDSNQHEMQQEIWMDDIYVDTSFRRITLSNSPRHSEMKHQEVQFFSSWTENKISFKPYYGSLNRAEPIYVYVYNENDVPNENGALLLSRPVIEAIN